VVLTCIALTVTLAGLSLTAAGAPSPGRASSAATAPRVESPEPRAALSIAPASVVPPSPEPAPRQVAVAAPRSTAPGPQAGGSAGIVVTVTDQFGRFVSNAAVVLWNPVTGYGTGDHTGHDGQFTASDLAAGAYQVTVSKPGFKKAVVTMPFEAGKQAKLQTVLALGSLQETVAVSAAAGSVASTGPAVPVARQVGAPPASDPCADTQEDGCVMPPRKLADAKPMYPASAAAGGVSGTVLIHARILADGTVGDLQPEPGSDADFADAAMQAIRLWTFSPAHLDGVAVPVDFTVTVQFEIAR
jgi:TonB family protein